MNYDNIIIYQFGKVASSSLKDSFKNFFKESNVYHIHNHNSPILLNLINDKNKNNLIITVVRNLIDRNLSAFISNINDNPKSVWHYEKYEYKENYSNQEIFDVIAHFKKVEKNI